MSKTQITAQDDRHVYITFTDLLSDEQITMEIWAPIPKEGGYSYVRYNDGKQLCEKLSSRGSTLMYKDGTKLVDLVRREYSAMRAADKRRAARQA
jgi:hypothetical protein